MNFFSGKNFAEFIGHTEKRVSLSPVCTDVLKAILFVKCIVGPKKLKKKYGDKFCLVRGSCDMTSLFSQSQNNFY